MGGASPAEADVPGRPSRREDRPRLLRVRREREEGTGGAVDPPEQVRADTAKAALWSALAGAALLALTVSPTAFQPPFYYPLVAIGFALILPVIAILHLRHRHVRESGAVLATIAGTAVVLTGLVTAVDPVLGAAGLVVRGIWWWTIGKMWWETAVLPPVLGLLTMTLAVFALLGSLFPTLALDALDAILGLWLLAVAASLWRIR